MKNFRQMITSIYRVTYSSIAKVASISIFIVGLSLTQFSFAQPPGPITIEADPRVQQLSYHFEASNEEMSYVLYVSSKVSQDKKNPLVIALHGWGGDGNFLLRDNMVDLAEEGGYIVVAPMGYHERGWYGSPVVAIGDQSNDPDNLTELSELDVMNVLAMMQEEFNVDVDRTYLMGHSMGGAGTLFLGAKYTSNWAAIAAIAPAAFMMQENRGEVLGVIQEAEIPVMIVQGDMDTAVPVENTRLWVDTMKTMDMEHEYLEFAGGDHGTVISDGMPSIFSFFEEHTK